MKRQGSSLNPQRGRAAGRSGRTTAAATASPAAVSRAASTRRHAAPGCIASSCRTTAATAISPVDPARSISTATTPPRTRRSGTAWSPTC
ncbi:hypothetical protein STCU_11448 [Strigomonas culicis]|uniref:Uncharacterized protein n=1 Tax=Strigomonas culicis TaxID=28005 RepID=S9TH48_9TRYP|nr:hypothetical protein STCU_11448 [Strigomonas culicis]|eukprot:EPY16244.1 hypothetical protein STCU_11448 [Strigomonas culicis]